MDYSAPSRAQHQIHDNPSGKRRRVGDNPAETPSRPPRTIEINIRPYVR
ncbi:hypothetical protein [Streptomyces sp. NPDC050564]